MTGKDLLSELFEHILGNTVIAMILCLTILGLFAMYWLKDPQAIGVIGNIVSAIAGAAGGASIALASKKNGGPPVSTITK